MLRSEGTALLLPAWVTVLEQLRVGAAERAEEVVVAAWAAERADIAQAMAETEALAAAAGVLVLLMPMVETEDLAVVEGGDGIPQVMGASAAVAQACQALEAWPVQSMECQLASTVLAEVGVAVY